MAVTFIECNLTASVDDILNDNKEEYIVFTYDTCPHAQRVRNTFKQHWASITVRWVVYPRAESHLQEQISARVALHKICGISTLPVIFRRGTKVGNTADTFISGVLREKQRSD